MSRRRNELRKQVREAEKGPLELRREEGKGNMLGGRRGRERRGHAPKRDSAPAFTYFKGLQL